MFFFLMILRPPRSTRTDTLFPYTTLFRSAEAAGIRLHAGLLQSPFEPARVTLQEIERLRALRRDDGAQCAVAGILQLHLDAAELGRVQFDADLVLAGDLGALDLDRKSTRLNSSH